MKELTLQEYVTALFVLATYEWYCGSEEHANNAMLVAVKVVERNHVAMA